MKNNVLIIILLIIVVRFSSQAQVAQQGQITKNKPNVLFIFIDDLRPELGAYGNENVHSPELDAVAQEGILFTKQYVTVPTCGASRYSLLRSMLPRSKAELGNEAANILSSPNGQQKDEPETFIEQFRRNGYYTIGMGKISHSADGYIYPYTEKKSNRQELPNSWDEFLFNPGKWETGWNAFFAYADGSNRNSKKGLVKPYEIGETDDLGYPDGLTAQLAISKLKELSAKEKPFFMGVGFFKPHLPFNAPKKYWELYDEASLPLSPTLEIPKHVNQTSLHGSAEFNQYKLGEEKASLDSSLSEPYARKLIHGYYASISYIDAQVGKLVKALKETGLDKNTIIVIWGDHGWHLGDYRVWGKHTLFDRSLRSTFIMKVPQLKPGKKIDRVISSIDIGPTLLELCNLPSMETDGRSFSSLFYDPSTTKWDDVAYSYFNDGISVVSDRYRLTKYFREAKPTVELYDHRRDPLEAENIAEQVEIPAKIEKLWQQGNTGLYNH